MENKNERKSLNKNIKLKNEKAITLVALVVTIIVLIILAGVSISLVLGDNGIVTKSKEARENYQIAANEEQVQLANYALLLSLKDQGLNYKESKETIKNPDRGFYLAVNLEIQWDWSEMQKKLDEKIYKSGYVEKIGCTLIQLRINIGDLSENVRRREQIFYVV